MTKPAHLLSNGLWFDNNAEEAIKFYVSLFPNSEIISESRYGKEGFEIHGRPEGTIMAMSFTLSGSEFVAINGGPIFKMNPSISFFIMCETAAEADKFWNALVDGGEVLMALDKYDWSERYGWLNDRYGVSWQIYTGQANAANQKIVPAFMFVGEQAGRAEEAINFYTSIFKNSEIEGIMHYPPGGIDPEGTVAHAQFTLSGQVFMALDSAMEHKFQFNEGVSIIVNCSNQEEIDYYWNKLTAGGKEVQCGWLKDKFGVSWQVVPVQLGEMLSSGDKEQTARVTKAFLKMIKFDIQELKEAFNG